MDRKTERNPASASRRPSLIQVMSASQAIFLLLLLLFGLGSLAVIRVREEERVNESRQADVDREWARFREELAGYENITLELLSEATENYDLLSPDSRKQFFAKQELYEKMTDLHKYNANIVYSFCGKEDRFYVAYGVRDRLNTIEARERIIANAQGGFADYPPAQWGIIRFETRNYLAYSLQENGLYCGVLINAEQILRQLSAITGTGGDVRVYDLNGHGTAEALSLQKGRDVYRTGPSDGLAAELMISPEKYGHRGIPVMLLILGLLCLAAFALQTLIAYRYVVKPLRRLSDRLGKYSEDVKSLTGEDRQEIEVNAATSELYTLQSSARHLLDEVILARLKDYEHQLSAQEMELLMMRSQLRPHFYLNALTTIDAMTYQNRNEDIRRFLQALSVHVRYMLRTDESSITLGEELRHIEAYLDMQGIRYPNRIFQVIDVPEELESREIPHLLIYTIVENCFKYALGVEDTLFLAIQGEACAGGFTVTVEDNGKGYPEEVIALINSEVLPEMTKEEKAHIGLRNVRRTMELKYGGRGKLTLSNIGGQDHQQGAVACLFFPNENESE